MDIVSHGLWAMALAKGANLKRRNTVKKWWAFFWGVFPDLFAFTIPFVFLFIALLSGEPLPTRPHAEPTTLSPGLHLASLLYPLSHSLVIFAIVLGAVWLIRRKPMWELTGWGLHILIDIPTHRAEFYPTPFLYPLADVRIDGFSWAEPWFMILNISLLICVYIGLWLLKKKRPS